MIKDAQAVATPKPSIIAPRIYSTKTPPSLSDFSCLCSQKITGDDYPLASEVIANIPIYDLYEISIDEASIETLKAEWHHVLISRPGVLVLKSMYRDKPLLERVNRVYQSSISSEK
jgi:hypothetical protein